MVVILQISVNLANLQYSKLVHIFMFIGLTLTVGVENKINSLQKVSVFNVILEMYNCRYLVTIINSQVENVLVNHCVQNKYVGKK